MSMKNIAKSGAEGNMRLLKSYGAGSTGPRQSYAPGYATGGVVKRAHGGPVATTEGMPSKGNLGRPGRKMKGKDSKKGTNVNVVIMQKPDGAKPDMPMPGPMAGPPPGADPPMPMPPHGPGGPPMPMRAKGGKVAAYKRGGKVKRAEGGEVDNKAGAQSRKAAKPNENLSALAHGAAVTGIGLGAGTTIAGHPYIGVPLMGAGIASEIASDKLGKKAVDGRNRGKALDYLAGRKDMPKSDDNDPGTERKSGGKVKHDDEAQDKALIRKMVKSDDLKPMNRREGGPAMKGVNTSAANEKGRMEKAKMQKKIK